MNLFKTRIDKNSGKRKDIYLLLHVLINIKEIKLTDADMINTREKLMQIIAEL
jgi:hypothetical protein